MRDIILINDIFENNRTRDTHNINIWSKLSVFQSFNTCPNITIILIIFANIGVIK